MRLGWLRAHFLSLCALLVTLAAYLGEPLAVQRNTQDRVGASQLEWDAQTYAALPSTFDGFWEAGAALHAALVRDPALYYVLEAPVLAGSALCMAWWLPQLFLVHCSWELLPRVLLLLALSLMVNTAMRRPLPFPVVQPDSHGLQLALHAVVSEAHVVVTPRVGIWICVAQEYASHTVFTLDAACTKLRSDLKAALALVYLSVIVLSAHHIHAEAWLLSLCMYALVDGLVGGVTHTVQSIRHRGTTQVPAHDENEDEEHVFDADRAHTETSPVQVERHRGGGGKPRAEHKEELVLPASTAFTVSDELSDDSEQDQELDKLEQANSADSTPE